MGSIVGFAGLTLAGYILIVLKVPILFIPIIIVSLILGWKKLIKAFKSIKLKFDRKTLIILTIFIIGISGQLAIISPSGRTINGDLVFWSSHAHDAAWHIALVDEIQRGWPLQNPVFAGQKLVNYHFFSDIMPALLGKYLPVTDFDLYFRIMPFIYSLFFGASAYFLTRKMTGNFSASIWAVIFSYFGGSFGYIATYIKDRTFGGESIFWASMPQSSSGNPPQIIADFLVMAFLYFVYSYITTKNKWSLISSILILGTLTEFKIYGALVLFAATLFGALWQIAIPSLLLGAVLYLPNSSGSTSFLIFQPWWFIRTMIVDPGRLNWLDLEHKRQTYIFEHNWKRVISIEVSGFLIFFFGNLGMRFIGFWDYLKFVKTSFKNKFNRIFVMTILISLIIPLLFLQKGVAPNTIQFLQYFILLLGILAGISTANILRAVGRPVYQYILATLIIVMMIPTQIALLYQFYSRPPLAKISAAEITALSFIKNNTDIDAVILTPEANPYIKQNGPISNIWAWTDTAYVAALSDRREYFSDKEQVDIMGYDFSGRESSRKTIFESKDPKIVREKIKETGVNLVYFPKPLEPKVNFGNLGLNLIFENSDVEVWKTN